MVMNDWYEAPRKAWLKVQQPSRLDRMFEALEVWAGYLLRIGFVLSLLYVFVKIDRIITAFPSLSRLF